MKYFSQIWRESKQHYTSIKDRAEWAATQYVLQDREEQKRLEIETAPGYIPNNPPPSGKLKPYRSFDDSNEDLSVCGIHFDAPTPYMRVLDASRPGEVDYYAIPTAMAHYATFHEGYTQEGQKAAIQRGREDLARDMRKLLGI